MPSSRSNLSHIALIAALVLAVAGAGGIVAGCTPSAPASPSPVASVPATPAPTGEPGPSSTPGKATVSVLGPDTSIADSTFVPILVNHQVDTSRFILGGVLLVGEQTPGYANPAGITSDGLTTSGVLRLRINAGQFELVIRQSGTPKVGIWVDGVQAGPAAVVTGYSGSGDGHILVQFSSNAEHLVDIEFGGFWKVKGVQLPPGATLLEPPPLGGPRAVWVSDSWGAGTAADANFESYTMVAARQLGWLDSANDGVGGSGYVNENTPGEAFPKRISDFTTHGQEMIVIAGSINDAKYDAATVGAAAAGLFDAVHAAVPNARVFVIGPCFNSTATPAIIANSDAIKAAVDARPWMGGFVQAYEWITDANSTMYIDPVTHHPSTAGHAYMGALAATALAALISGSTSSPAPSPH